MKKRTWFILGLGILMIIAGSSSSVFFYKRVEADRVKNSINKEFKYDNSTELIINVNNRTSLFLTNSENDTVYMKKEDYNYTSKKDNTDWRIDKKGSTTTITIENENRKFEPSFFNFGSFSDNTVNLEIPDNYKKVTINGNSLDIDTHDLTVNTLALKSKNGTISANNIIADQLTLGNTNGSIYLSDSKVANNIDLTATNGEVTLSEVSFIDLNAKLTNGSLSTYSTKGNIVATNQSGDMDINHAKGNVKATNKNGDIRFQSSAVNYDLDLETVHGSIDISMNEDAYAKNKVDLSTNLGSISIFNENLDSSREYTRNTGTNTIKAASKNGDISIDEYYEDDPEYWDE